MSDRPTPHDPHRPEQTPPAGADATTVLPQADQAAPTGATAAPPPRSGPRRWWGEATSSSGGRAALVAAAVLGTLLLVTGIGLAVALVGDDDDRWGEERASMSDGRWPGMGDGRGQGNGQGQGQGGRQQGGGTSLPGPNPGNPGNPGNGNGMAPGRGGAGLDDVLHGEYTTNVTGTPTVMVVQNGQVTAYTAGSSLTVRSSDGFEATYTLDGSAVTGRAATDLATGAQVRVVAAKEGMKVTRLLVG